MQLLGERLRTLREGLNMTQVQIGELSPSGSITVRRDCICDDPTNAIYIGNELFSIRHGGVSVRHSEDRIRKMFAPVLEEERFRELFDRAVKVEEKATAI